MPILKHLLFSHLGGDNLDKTCIVFISNSWSMLTPRLISDGNSFITLAVEYQSYGRVTSTDSLNISTVNSTLHVRQQLMQDTVLYNYIQRQVFSSIYVENGDMVIAILLTVLVHLSRRFECTIVIMCCTSSVSRPSVVCPSLTFHIFIFSSETVERNSKTLSRKQDLEGLYKVCVFRADWKNKMTVLSLIG